MFAVTSVRILLRLVTNTLVLAGAAVIPAEMDSSTFLDTC